MLFPVMYATKDKQEGKKENAVTVVDEKIK